MLGLNTGIANSWNTLLSALRATIKNNHYKKAAARRDTGEETDRKVGDEREMCGNKSQWKHSGLH